MRHQVFQDPRLLAGQRQGLPVGGNCPRTGIKGELPAAQHHILLGKLPQGQAADARLQLRQMEGLCQIVIGAGIQTRHLILHLAASREDQHRCLSVGLPQGAQHRHSVLFRQVQIQQHQIVPLRFQQLQRLLAVVAAIHAVGRPPQAAGDGVAQGALVLYNQKVHSCLLNEQVVSYYSRAG